MPPTRSDAAVAAAPATTRSGRVKKVSKAALSSVANENREAQQARRSRTGGKSVRRDGVNAQGQSIATETPAVSISTQTTRPSRAVRRSPLRPLNKASKAVHPSQPTSTPRSALEISRYSNTRTPATLAPLPSHCEPSVTTPSLNNTTTAPHQQPPQELRVAGNDVEEEISEDGEIGDREEPCGGGGGWRDDGDDWDEGASDEYVPEEVGDEADMEEGSDRMEVEFGNGENGGDGDEEDEGVDIGEKKKRAARHSKKAKKTAPKASDYSPEVESLLNHAAGFMRALVMAENPMPSVDDSISLATDAFEMAKRERPHVTVPDDIAHISILRRCIPQVRGRVKDAARAKVGDSYGFDDRPSMQQKNRRLYLDLLDEDSYVCEKPDTFDGPYYHPICFKTLKSCFFNKSSDDGVAYSEWFSPIRMETIALAFTAVRMCLDEWKSGSYKPLMFSSDVYEPVYQVHLANLKAMEQEDPSFVKGLGEELWEDCSEPFDLGKTRKPAASITDTHKLNGVVYGQERRNARAARKAAAAATVVTGDD